MMVVEPITWRGTPAEWFDLQRAIANNCTCDNEHPERGECTAHRLLHDQKALNHLGYLRSLTDKLNTEEWSVARRHNEDVTDA
jgi:hypothetical protein